MPAINVSVAGLDDALSVLARIPGAVRAALADAAKILSDDGTRYWRSIVTVRTGRMRSALSVRVVAQGSTVHVYYYTAPRGFYYTFQRRAREWDAQLAQYLVGRAPAVIRSQIDRQLASL